MTDFETQTIEVVLARTNWDGGETAWREYITTEIKVNRMAGTPEWHVVGELANEEVE